MRVTLRQLELFSAVARAGSTAAAGAEISLSQSAVSAALNELELSLGAQLFDRVNKKLVLNDIGRALFARATRLLDSARSIEHDFGRPNQLGHLKLAASTTVGNYLIPDLLAAYSKRYPHRRVDVQIVNSQEVVKAVSELRADAGVIEGPSRMPGLTLTHWRDDELILVAAPHHELAILQRTSRSRVPIDRLRSAGWILREEGSGTRDAVQAVLVPYLGELACRLVLGGSEAIKRAVGAGLGISCLSRLLVQDMLERGTLVELATELPAMSRPLYLVVHPERVLSEAAASFLH